VLEVPLYDRRSQLTFYTSAAYAALCCAVSVAASVRPVPNYLFCFARTDFEFLMKFAINFFYILGETGTGTREQDIRENSN